MVMVVVQELVLKIIMQILFIFNESDASIKKLSNIYINKDTGYELNGTLIGFDILDDSSYDDAVWIYQNSGKLYCGWIKHYGDGGALSGNKSCNADIVYI